MRLPRIATLLSTMLICSAAVAEDDPRADAKKELARLQGVWTLTAMESEGHALPPDQLQGRTSRYDGDLVSLRSGNDVRRRGVVTINPGRKPKAINTWDLDGPYEDQTVPGIYELSPDGNTLKLCFARPGDDRPSAFTTKDGTGFLLVVYTRKKP